MVMGTTPPVNPQAQPAQVTYQGFNKEDVARLWSDPAEIFENLEHALRLHELTKEGWIEYPKTDPKYTKPMINKKGWRQIQALMYHYINPLNMTSQQTGDEISLKCIHFARLLGKMVRTNWRLWEIEVRNIPQIISQTEMCVELALFKTKDMKFLEMLSIIRKESYNMAPQQNTKAQFTGLG